jgi:hypothetical protein
MRCTACRRLLYEHCVASRLDEGTDKRTVIALSLATFSQILLVYRLIGVCREEQGAIGNNNHTSTTRVLLMHKRVPAMARFPSQASGRNQPPTRTVSMLHQKYLATWHRVVHTTMGRREAIKSQFINVIGFTRALVLVHGIILSMNGERNFEIAAYRGTPRSVPRTVM